MISLRDPSFEHGYIDLLKYILAKDFMTFHTRGWFELPTPITI